MINNWIVNYNWIYQQLSLSMDIMTGIPFVLGGGNQKTDNIQFPISPQWHDSLYMALNLSLGQTPWLSLFYPNFKFNRKALTIYLQYVFNLKFQRNNTFRSFHHTCWNVLLSYNHHINYINHDTLGDLHTWFLWST